MIGVDVFDAAKIKPPGSAMIQRVTLLQALVSKPNCNFIVGNDGSAGALGDVRRVREVVGMAVRNEDVISGNGFDINTLGQLVAGNERIEQKVLVRNPDRKAGVTVISDLHAKTSVGTRSTASHFCPAHSKDA